jgi:hypothetical protein
MTATLFVDESRGVESGIVAGCAPRSAAVAWLAAGCGIDGTT